MHEIVVDDAPWIFIVHDLNPRALSPKVKGFVQAAVLVSGFDPRVGGEVKAPWVGMCAARQPPSYECTGAHT